MACPCKSPGSLRENRHPVRPGSRRLDPRGYPWRDEGRGRDRRHLRRAGARDPQGSGAPRSALVRRGAPGRPRLQPVRRGAWQERVGGARGRVARVRGHPGLPIPRWTLAQGKIDDDFPLPAIVKPAAEDASAGLDRGSVVTDRKALRARVAAMTEQFDEVLVQEYVAGREFNVGLVGSRTLPISEIDFARMPEGAWPILTYAGKWDAGSADDLGSVPVCPAAIPQKLADKLVKLAEAAWRILQGKGYGRVDLRVDEQGRAWVLDVNPNPDLNDDAGLSRMAKAAGWDYAELVRRVAEVALREAQGAKAARELLAPPRRPRATRTA